MVWDTQRAGVVTFPIHGLCVSAESDRWHVTSHSNHLSLWLSEVPPGWEETDRGASAKEAIFGVLIFLLGYTQCCSGFSFGFAISVIIPNRIQGSIQGTRGWTLVLPVYYCSGFIKGGMFFAEYCKGSGVAFDSHEKGDVLLPCYQSHSVSVSFFSVYLSLYLSLSLCLCLCVSVSLSPPTRRLKSDQEAV